MLRVISVNVHTANERSDLVKQLIRDQDPDVVLLLEVNAKWVAALEELQPVYPYRQVEFREDNFGIALYSKHALTACRTMYLGEAGLPTVVGEIEIAGKQLTIVGTHPLPPISRAYTALRNEQLEAVARYVASITGPKIVMGDLNTSPWSHCFSRLINERNCSTARGEEACERRGPPA